ncbi:ABC transporter ATP-binding protein [Lachnospiraceae bacterium]|nr:ABC transporter ATP-binding protein [Lachnospiraceae bacterium]
MEALRVVDLCKTYITNKRQNNVLKNVNFTIEQGEMAAVMGPSGSGKSTLLYSVSGMDRPTAGKVILAGKTITQLKEKELANVRLNEMGFIFQQMYMLKNLTVMDNILLPAYQSQNKERSQKEIDAYAAALMRRLGISEIAENDITEVSGGQLQRACICRSMINRPRILFADEPTGALNRGASEEVMKELNKLNAEGATIMLVTHDMKVAAKCSRILYIVDGNIKGELPLGKLYCGADVNLGGKDNEQEAVDMEKLLRERERKLNSWLIEMGW